MKLREVKFNDIRAKGYIGLALVEGTQWIDQGFIGEVLKRNEHLADREVVEQRPYFDVWVIDLKKVEAT